MLNFVRIGCTTVLPVNAVKRCIAHQVKIFLSPFATDYTSLMMWIDERWKTFISSSQRLTKARPKIGKPKNPSCSLICLTRHYRKMEKGDNCIHILWCLKNWILDSVLSYLLMFRVCALLFSQIHYYLINIMVLLIDDEQVRKFKTGWGSSKTHSVPLGELNIINIIKLLHRFSASVCFPLKYVYRCLIEWTGQCITICWVEKEP